MVLMVRSFRSTVNILKWFPLSVIILLSIFAIYYVDSKPSFSTGDISLYNRRLVLDTPNKDSKDSIPSNNNLYPTDLVLVSTLDGSIRGIDRFEGRVYWTLRGRPGSSLIKSTSMFETHKDNVHKKEQEEDKLFDDIVPDVDSGDQPDDFSNDNDFNDIQEPWQNDEGDNIYYIIEPQNGGGLYTYGDGRPLEKLPFTINQIVTNSPFRTQDGTTYLGKKSTIMLAIDPRTGNILQKFDLNEIENVETIATQTHLPPRTLFLGRNEYKVAIYYNNKKRWNVTYSEYIPNKLDWDMPNSAVPSDIYIAPDANHAITGINVRNGNLLWTMDLPYPAVSIFDVYRREDFTITVTKQDPPKALDKGIIGDMMSVIQRGHGISTAYVGVHEGTLYALSTKNYPLMQISKWASMYTGRKPGDHQQLIEGGSRNNASFPETEWKQMPHELCCRGCEYHVDCLIGQHVVQSLVEEDELNKRLYLPTSLPQYPSQMPLYADTKEGFFYDGYGKFWKSYVLVSSVLVYVYRDRVQTFYKVRILPKWKKIMKKHSRAKKTRARINAVVKAEKEKIQRERSNTVDSMDSIDVASIKPKETNEPRKRAGRKKEKKEVAPEEEEEEDIDEESSKVAIVKTYSSTGLDLENFVQSKSRVLELSDAVLGYGSHGTVVYKGQFDGREVAVKRLLLDFYDVALKEVKLLQESDDHPNVVRYFYKEESDRFLYIALELCYGSLNDYMERSLPLPEMQLCDTMNNANILSQMTCGIQYLHSLKIVHRDIKPHNILLAPSKNRFAKNSPPVRILISDFGLCKKLDGEQSSFNYTAASPAGTSGWRAPELLAWALAAPSSDTSLSSGRESSSDPNLMMGRVKATRAIDIFSTGCVFYYVLSGGDHPFGNRFGRENNILQGLYDLSKLDSMGEDGVEAKDLVERMISVEPKQRPTADSILTHPFFWTPAKRLAFLQDASDRFEIEERDPPSQLLQCLEKDAEKVIGVDWYKRIDKVVANDLGKYRRYDGKRVRDLLRALRNKKHHWQDLPEPVKKVYGEPPNQFLYYFTARFPHLFLHTYYVVASHSNLRKEGSLDNTSNFDFQFI